MTPGEYADLLVDLIREQINYKDVLSQRIIANRIREEIDRWSPRAKDCRPYVSPVLEPFTDAEAKAVGAEVMQFGKFVGRRIDEVELEYLEWLADASRDTWRKLARYVRSRRVSVEVNNELVEWED
jgi:hypothetical protein